MRMWDADILHLALEEEDTTDLDDDNDAATAERGEDLLFGCSLDVMPVYVASSWGGGPSPEQFKSSPFIRPL